MKDETKSYHQLKGKTSFRKITGMVCAGVVAM